MKSFGLDTLQWWEVIVKPGIKRLLIERGKELNNMRSGLLNLLFLKQAYFVKKLQRGDLSKLAALKIVQIEIQTWYEEESEKVKIQSRTDEVDNSEKVRIYHHELHAKHIKRSSILKLKTEQGLLEGHAACAGYLEQAVGDLLLHPAVLDEGAQQELLAEVQPVFTDADNTLMTKIPDKQEVKESIWSANLHAAPGTDGLTSFLYYH